MVDDHDGFTAPKTGHFGTPLTVHWFPLAYQVDEKLAMECVSLLRSISLLACTANMPRRL